jgi:hypothetical protein
VNRPHIQALLSRVSPYGAIGEQIQPEMLTLLAERYPADYVEFLTVLGGGTLDAHLRILVPEEIAGPRPYGWTMENESGTAQTAWDRRWAEDGRPGEAPVLVAWAVDSMPYIYCWVAEDEDPDRWPVRVVDQRGPGLQVDCGMVEFMVRMLDGEFDVELFARPDPTWRTRRRFVQRHEDERLLKAGINPWKQDAPGPDPRQT